MRSLVTGCAGLTRPLPDTATIAFVISPVITLNRRSGPRWLMALADCGAAEMLGALMLGSDKTGTVRAFVTASSVRSQDADLYRRYAAVLYRQALLTRGDPALAERVVCDVIVNEAALARIPERGEDDARYRLTESVLRRCQHLAAGAMAIYPRDMAALLRAVMPRLASSSAAVAEEGSQVRTAAAGRQRARRREAEVTACSGIRDINVAGRRRGPADEREENDANNRIHDDDRRGSRRGDARAGGGEIAAGCAAVPNDEENVVN
jgi:hypothetical protein